MGSQSDSYPTEPAVAGQEAAEKSIWQVIAGIFSSPAAAFASFDRKPQIIIPLIIVLLVGGLNSALMAPYMADTQYELMKTSPIMPAQQLEQMKEPHPVRAAVLGGVFVVLGTVVTALLIWPIGTFIFGGSTTFKRIWGVAILGSFMMHLGNLVKIPLMMAKSSAYVSFGLAALFPGKDFTSLVYTFLYYMDGFAVWSLVISGIGYAAIYKFTRGKGIFMSGAVFVVLSIFMIALSAVGMSFAQIKISFF